jgi:hypothetical protein
MEDYNPAEWYTPAQARQRLSENSGGKEIDESYLRTLAKIGKVDRLVLGPKYSLYRKSQIDTYKVTGRGEKWSKNNKKTKEAKPEDTKSKEVA